MTFTLNAGTAIRTENPSGPVKNAIAILRRDMARVFTQGERIENEIVLRHDPGLEGESFVIDISAGVTVSAPDDLGFIYALLYVSEKFLGVLPFWFWMDQRIKTAGSIDIPYGRHVSPKPAVKYRGWFFNDEVLIMRWNIGGDGDEPWRMAFEALLRCGGNMCIPGTDKNSRKYRALAAGMGLRLTHHHAEPLGAEMFVRAYPGIEPDYSKHPELFHRLWEEGVTEQKDYSVIWNVGFRGQGDCPFWSHDENGAFNTPEKRGRLISELIGRQCDIVRRHVKNPVFCTNLYGEVMELYAEGHIDLPDGIIKVSADNGYGKMVTRRRDNHSARVPSMPVGGGSKGIYYHVSFYDLQAANHITRLPNSLDFVDRELSEVMRAGGDSYWIINCSNVRPHAYCLDAIRKKWYGADVSEESHSADFARMYYSGSADAARCLREYPGAVLEYGPEEDEHAGEQFYTENIRLLANQFIRDRNGSADGLHWLTGDIPLNGQVEAISSVLAKGYMRMSEYWSDCQAASAGMSGGEKLLFDATVLLHAEIHRRCQMGVLAFMAGIRAFSRGDYKDSFMSFGMSAKLFEGADEAMRGAEYGVWKGFYFNDCFADIKHTAYMVGKVMGVVREFGDNPRHDEWYRDAVYSPEDRHVMTLLVNDNHMTDRELFEAFIAAEAPPCV